MEVFNLKYLNEKQYRCIEMLCQENYEITKIAEELGVCRWTIYNWMKDEKFKAELAKSEQDIKTRVHHMFVQRLPAAVEKLWKLTDCSDNRTRLQATKEWVERSIGKVNTSVTLEDKRDNADESSLDEIMRRADEMLKQSESKDE